MSIMRANNQSLFRIVRSILQSDAEAEEVVQAAYVTAFTNMEQLTEGARLESWLRRIAVNRAYDRLRQVDRERRTQEGTREFELHRRSSTSASASPEQAAARGQLRKNIELAVDELPDTLRSVFVLRDVQEMSGAETADSLGIEEGAVRVRLHRARGLMRARLGDQAKDCYPEAFHFAGERCDRIVERTLAELRLRGLLRE